MKRTSGHYHPLGSINYFIPDPLPPKNPSFEMNAELVALFGDAMHQLGKLNEMSQRIPNVRRFIKAYIIKEALLSSAIEGIHTTIIDVFTQPLSTITPNKETQLVVNYIHALEASQELMHSGPPISTRLIQKAHSVLMSCGQGETASPGNFRKQSVCVGNLVPPPAHQLADLMSSLEHYINYDTSLPPLIQAGLIHVHFETIHPFLDGNGRIGRLLIVLMLIDQKLINAPLLYPSYYFKKHSLDYYYHLDKVRTNGDFEGWILFYLKAITATAADAHARALKIELLEKTILTTLEQTHSRELNQDIHKILTVLFEFPHTTVDFLAQQTMVAPTAIHNVLAMLVNLEFVYTNNADTPATYTFNAYLNVLEQEQ